MRSADCPGPAGIARPAPWLLCALAWMTALAIAPVSDLLARDTWFAPMLALMVILASTATAVLAGTFASRAARWLIPLSLSTLAFLAVLTTVAYGEPWWNTWILFAAAAAGVWQGRGGLLVVLVVPASASLTLWGTGASGAQIYVLALTVFLAGAVNHVLVRLLQTIGALRVAQDELAGRTVAEERERFSRDLHDLLGHTLSVIVVKAEAVRRLSQRDPGAAMQHTLDIEAIGRQALVEVREAVDGYRRTSLAGEVARARVALDAATISADLRVTGTSLPPEVEEALAWVLREGVTNVIRHSGAGTCRLLVDVRDGTVRLELVDDGPGSRADPPRPGGGLTGLRQRLAQVHGELSATRSDAGFHLVATVPVAAMPVAVDESRHVPPASSVERR